MLWKSSLGHRGSDLDGVSDEQAVHSDLAALRDAVHACHCLLLNRRVQGRLQQDHVVCARLRHVASQISAD